MSAARTALRPCTIDDAIEKADAAEFERQFKRWPLGKEIDLPLAQVKMMCQTFFNFGASHGAKWTNDQFEEAVCRDIDQVIADIDAVIADRCVDCGHTPDSGACITCKMD